METKIRQANTSDVERIQELSAELSQMEAEEYDPSIDPEWVLTEEATHWYQDRIQKENGFAVVAHDQDQIIGYTVGVIAPAEPYRKADTLKPTKPRRKRGWLALKKSRTKLALNA